MPAELIPQFSTIEYSLQRNVLLPMVFLFVVDLCQDDENLKAVKVSNLSQCFSKCVILIIAIVLMAMDFIASVFELY